MVMLPGNIQGEGTMANEERTIQERFDGIEGLGTAVARQAQRARNAFLGSSIGRAECCRDIRDLQGLVNAINESLGMLRAEVNRE